MVPEIPKCGDAGRICLRCRVAACLGVTALGFILAAWSLSGGAFQLNPCLRDLTYQNSVLSQAPHGGRLNLCDEAPRRFQFSAVHEHMTAFAVAKYRGVQHWSLESDRPGVFRYLVEPSWPKAGGTTHRTRDIILGSWWNDDPMMLMWGQGEDLINGMRSMEKFFGSSPRYPGSLGASTVDATQSIGWHSHFGRLQHLHFMTNLPESQDSRQKRVTETTDKALQWMSFAFEVATRADGSKPADKLDSARADKLGLPSVALNFGVDPSNVRIRTLFARAGLSTSDRDSRTPDVALGSMLHIIQDSFSPAHACRVPGFIDGKPAALLRDVYSYSGQDKDRHKSLDGVPPWLERYAKTGEHEFINDPVEVGRWIIGAVDQGLEWRDVEAHLRATIFAEVDSGADHSSAECIGGRP